MTAAHFCLLPDEIVRHILVFVGIGEWPVLLWSNTNIYNMENSSRLRKTVYEHKHYMLTCRRWLEWIGPLFMSMMSKYRRFEQFEIRYRNTAFFLDNLPTHFELHKALRELSGVDLECQRIPNLSCATEPKSILSLRLFLHAFNLNVMDFSRHPSYAHLNNWETANFWGTTTAGCELGSSEGAADRKSCVIAIYMPCESTALRQNVGWPAPRIILSQQEIYELRRLKSSGWK